MTTRIVESAGMRGMGRAGRGDTERGSWSGNGRRLWAHDEPLGPPIYGISVSPASLSLLDFPPSPPLQTPHQIRQHRLSTLHREVCMNLAVEGCEGGDRRVTGELGKRTVLGHASGVWVATVRRPREECGSRRLHENIRSESVVPCPLG